MSKEIIKTGIDFNNSTFKSFEKINGCTLAIVITSFDKKRVKIIFHNFIQFFYRRGNHLLNMYQIFEESDFLNEALLLDYQKIPKDHPFKLFQVEDLDHVPLVKVVAKSIEILKI